MPTEQHILIAGLCCACLLSTMLSAVEVPNEETAPTEIQDPAASTVPNFQQDILPMLRRSCLACHNASTADGEVVLESPQSMLAYYDADDPLIVPGDAAAGKLLAIAAHRQEPFMPPGDNDVGATPLTPVELGLLKLWIEQGAKASEQRPTEDPISWQPLPSQYGPILSTAITAYGDLCVCSRGNRLEVYDLLRGTRVAKLADPSFQQDAPAFRDAAHRDLVRSLAVTADGEWIASGGYRTVRLWKRNRRHQSLKLPGEGMPQVLEVTPQWTAVGDDDGWITMFPRGAAAEHQAVSIRGHDAALIGLAYRSDGRELISVAANGEVGCWRAESGERLAAWQLSIAPRRMTLVADERLVTASEDLVLRLWKLDRTEETTATVAPADEATGSTSGEVSAKPEDDVSVKPVALEPMREYRGHGREITTLIKLPGETAAFLTASVDGTVRAWDIEKTSETDKWIHGYAIHAVAVTPEGANIVSAGADGNAKIWVKGEPEPQREWLIDFPAARHLDRMNRSVEIAAANVTYRADALKAARQQLATDRETQGKALEQLANAEKDVAEKQEALDTARDRHRQASQAAKHATDLQSLAEQAQELFQQRLQNPSDDLSHIAKLLKSVEQYHAQSVTRNDQQESTTPESNAAQGETLEPTSALAGADELATSLDQFRASASQLDKTLNNFLATVKKRSQEATAQVEQIAKEIDPAQQAVDEAHEQKQDAAAAVRRAEEGVEASNQVVQRMVKQHERAQQILARQEQNVDDYRDSRSSHSQIATVACSTDGKQLLFGRRDGRLFLFHVEGYAASATWQVTANLCAAQYAAGPDSVVTLCGDQTRTLDSWSTTSEWQLHDTIGDTRDTPSLLVGRVSALDFSADGRLLAIGGGEASRSGQVIIWDLERDRLHCELAQPHTDAVQAVAFSRDGEHLATGSADRMMKTFRVADGEHLRNYEGHTHHVLDVAWRANGRQLATASADKTIKIWDVESGEQIRTIRGHGKEVTGIEFLGIGNEVVSTSGDRSVRIHNADDGKQLRTLPSATNYLYCCAATESGDVVLTGGADRTLRVFNASDGSQLFAFE